MDKNIIVLKKRKRGGFMAKVIKFNDLKTRKNVNKAKTNNNIDKEKHLQNQKYLLFDDDQLISKIYLKEM